MFGFFFAKNRDLEKTFLFFSSLLEPSFMSLIFYMFELKELMFFRESRRGLDFENSLGEWYLSNK